MFRILLFSCLLVSNVFAMHSPAAATDDPRGYWWNWVFALGHLGYNINSIYWEMDQNTQLGNVKYQDKIEDDVPWEDRYCKDICRYNCRKIYERSKDIQNWNTVAMATNALGILFNIGTLWKLGWNDAEDYKIFERVALGTSVLSSFFNIAAFGTMADYELYYREKVPIGTLGGMDKALSSGVGYLLPAVPVAGYGMAFLGKNIHYFLTLLDKQKKPT